MYITKRQVDNDWTSWGHHIYIGVPHWPFLAVWGTHLPKETYYRYTPTDFQRQAEIFCTYIIRSRGIAFQVKHNWVNFFTCDRLKEYSFLKCITQMRHRHYFNMWNWLCYIRTNVYEEIIEVLRYWHFISGNWSITHFEFCTMCRIFILVNNIFYNSPWFLHVVLISCYQFMTILLLGSNQCLLKYLFIRFITGLIIHRANFLNL